MIIPISLFILLVSIGLILFMKIKGRSSKTVYMKICIVFMTLVILFVYHSLNPFLVRQNYDFITDKDMGPLKIILFSDTHIDHNLKVDLFAKYVERMKKEKPDVVIIAGDLVDGKTTKKDMIKVCKILGSIKVKYGVYFVYGNHDRTDTSYAEFGEKDLVNMLNENGVHILKDENVLIENQFYIIGRDDLSMEDEDKPGRKSMDELMQNVEQSKYIIVVDHQPFDYENQARNNIDLVLSGHTHGVNKSADFVYGHEQRGETHFVVTSGLDKHMMAKKKRSSSLVNLVWSIPQYTMKSEYVVIEIKHQ